MSLWKQEKSIKFKPYLQNIKSTLDSLELVMEKIGDHNMELGLPDDEIQELKLEMVAGIKLVHKLSKASSLTCLKPNYTDQLVELDESLKRMLEMLKLQGVRDVKETLVLARKMDTALNQIGVISLAQGDNVASLVEGVALAAGLKELHDVVDETLLHQRTPPRLAAGLESVQENLVVQYPRIYKLYAGDFMSSQKNGLDHVQLEELKKIRKQIEDCVELVRKCFYVFQWTSYKEEKYNARLVNLENSLQALAVRLNGMSIT